MIIFIRVLVLLISVIIHEVAHGYMAFLCGDDTAKRYGRLAINPLKHLDPVGSLVIPLLLTLANSPIMLGWAKPIPIDPQKFRNPKMDIIFVSIAGPLVNIILIFVNIIALRFINFYLLSKYNARINIHAILNMQALQSIHLMDILVVFSFYMVIINTVLAVFNLIPIPPLDGSRLLMPFISSSRMVDAYKFMEKYGIAVIFLLLYLNVFDSLFYMSLSLALALI